MKNDRDSMLTNNFVVSFVKRNMMILVALAIMFAVLSVGTDTFMTSRNILSVLRQISINGVLAFGMAMTLIIGGIDLSVGSVMALAGCFCVGMINGGIDVILAVLLSLVLGGFCGLINGFIAAFTEIPSFIITLATQQCFRGIAFLLTDGKAVSCFDETFCALGTISIGPVPFLVVITFIVLFTTSVLLSQTKFGRSMYAIGGNKSAAIYAGINVRRVTLCAYVIPGIYAALSGVILAARVYSAQPGAGDGYEGDAIAAAVLGGVSFSGGIGSAGGVMLGVLVIGFMNNGLNMLKVSSYWQMVAKGLVILLAVYLDTLKKHKRLKMKKHGGEA